MFRYPTATTVPLATTSAAYLLTPSWSRKLLVLPFAKMAATTCESIKCKTFWPARLAFLRRHLMLFNTACNSKLFMWAFSFQAYPCKIDQWNNLALSPERGHAFILNGTFRSNRTSHPPFSPLKYKEFYQFHDFGGFLGFTYEPWVLCPAVRGDPPNAD